MRGEVFPKKMWFCLIPEEPLITSVSFQAETGEPRWLQPPVAPTPWVDGGATYMEVPAGEPSLALPSWLRRGKTR